MTLCPSPGRSWPCRGELSVPTSTGEATPTDCPAGRNGTSGFDLARPWTREPGRGRSAEGCTASLGRKDPCYAGDAGAPHRCSPGGSQRSEGIGGGGDGPG